MAYGSRKTALTGAQRVRKRMNNPEAWRIDVWNSGSWHCGLLCGGLSLHIHSGSPFERKVSYFAMFSSTDPGGGEMHWTSNEDSRSDPNEAVQACLERVESYLNRANEAFSQVKKAVEN